MAKLDGIKINELTKTIEFLPSTFQNAGVTVNDLYKALSQFSLGINEYMRVRPVLTLNPNEEVCFIDTRFVDGEAKAIIIHLNGSKLFGSFGPRVGERVQVHFGGNLSYDIETTAYGPTYDADGFTKIKTNGIYELKFARGSSYINNFQLGPYQKYSHILIGRLYHATKKAESKPTELYTTGP